MGIRCILDQPIDGRVDLLTIQFLKATEVDKNTRAGLPFVIIAGTGKFFLGAAWCSLVHT